MNKTEIKLKYEICKADESGIPVIIVAAGAALRMQGINKQLFEINGIPIIIKTLLAFERSHRVSKIILVVRDNDLFTLQMLTEKYSISKLTDIVCGGETRQESVLKGFSRLGSDDRKVLIHDGARPFVKEDIISAVTDALETNPAVTCAVKVKDTIKQVDADSFVSNTLDRSSLVAVQTPQGVWVEEYLGAVKKTANLSAFTDDTSIMEAAGYNAFVVEGDYKNIKLTTPEDIAVAKSFWEDYL